MIGDQRLQRTDNRGCLPRIDLAFNEALQSSETQLLEPSRVDPESWDDSHNWWLMGQEQAAEIVAWGLMDDQSGSVYLYSESCQELAAAFELLTGIPPLDTHTDNCES